MDKKVYCGECKYYFERYSDFFVLHCECAHKKNAISKGHKMFFEKGPEYIPPMVKNALNDCTWWKSKEPISWRDRPDGV